MPPGNTGILAGVSENFAFHSSPEAFLVARILQHHKDHPEEVRERAPVRAKILNRNIIVFSSYHQVKEVLCGNEKDASGDAVPSFVAMPAYRQLMQDFFPHPNLLLNDGASHERMKVPWRGCIRSLETTAINGIRTQATDFFAQIPRGSEIDLYGTLKRLSWRLFLDSVLGLSDTDPDFERYVKLQEDLLRGQFSLFPASVNVGFWHSPRKIGIDSRKRLQELISRRLKKTNIGWISENRTIEPPRDELVNHVLMATSSLAVKGFASLMLALLLNLFLFPHLPFGVECLAEWATQGDHETRRKRIEAVLKETLRLSPPVVGVLRRATRDCTVTVSDAEKADVLIPAGFEAWSYFPGANRDPTVFGEDAEMFVPERFIDAEGKFPPPIAFGEGSKSCLGADFVSTAAFAVVETLLDAGINISGTVDAAGVRGWLGQEVPPATPEAWARDMKQLPVQRPSRPILVVFHGNS